MSVMRSMLEAAWDEASFFGALHARSFPTVARTIGLGVECALRPRTRVVRAEGDGVSIVHHGHDAQLFAMFCELFGAIGPVTTIRREASFPPRLQPEDADITFVEIDLAFASAAARRGFLVLPRWVGFEIDLTIPAHQSWNDKKRTKLARVAHEELDAEVVPATAALDEFFHRMYVPTAKARHHTRAFVRRIRFVRRAAEHGWLVFARKAGVRVAGLLVVPRREPAAVDAWLFGVRDGDYVQVSASARDAVWLFALRFARETLRAKTFGLTAAPPLLADGLFRFKKRLGARAVFQSHRGAAVAVFVRRATPRVVAGFARSPLVHLRRGASLCAVSAANDRSSANALARHTSPGVEATTVLVGDASQLPALFADRARACL